MFIGTHNGHSFKAENQFKIFKILDLTIYFKYLHVKTTK